VAAADEGMAAGQVVVAKWKCPGWAVCGNLSRPPGPVPPETSVRVRSLPNQMPSGWQKRIRHEAGVIAGAWYGMSAVSVWKGIVGVGRNRKAAVEGRETGR